MSLIGDDWQGAAGKEKRRAAKIMQRRSGPARYGSVGRSSVQFGIAKQVTENFLRNSLENNKTRKGTNKMAMAKKRNESTGPIELSAPNYKVFVAKIVGTAPFVSNNFSEEARTQLADSMAAGSAAKQTKNKREPKDFQKGYEGSLHKDAKANWHGIPATAFRAALVRACSLVGLEMTKAKMTIFVLADGFENDGKPLVKITKGKPKRFDAYCRNANGSPDIRARAQWDAGWEAVLQIRYDADFVTEKTVASLVQRAGISVGVGAGRPFSTDSCGQGWGTFDLADAVRVSKPAA